VKHFPGLEINEAQTELLGAANHTINQARAVKLIVGRCAGIAVNHLAAQDMVNQYGEFAGGGGNGLGLAQPVSQAAIVGSQCRRCASGSSHSGAGLLPRDWPRVESWN
jgi:hypothetical protein